METSKTNSKILKWSVVIGIVIVLNLFFNYTITLFYKNPTWENFCQQKQVVEQLNTQAECISSGGQWFENELDSSGQYYKTQPTTADKNISKGYCNQNFECDKQYQDARELYTKNRFIILTALGVLSIIIGILTVSVSFVVSTGLSYGGVLSLIIASISYWSFASDILRFFILAVALAVLIWFGIKKFKE